MCFRKRSSKMLTRQRRLWVQTRLGSTQNGRPGFDTPDIFMVLPIKEFTRYIDRPIVQPAFRKHRPMYSEYRFLPKIKTLTLYLRIWIRYIEETCMFQVSRYRCNTREKSIMTDYPNGRVLAEVLIEALPPGTVEFIKEEIRVGSYLGTKRKLFFGCGVSGSIEIDRKLICCDKCGSECCKNMLWFQRYLHCMSAIFVDDIGSCGTIVKQFVHVKCRHYRQALRIRNKS